MVCYSPQRRSLCKDSAMNFFVHRWFLAAAIAAVFASTSLAADLPRKKVLPLEVAKQVAAAAEKHARENKWNVCIAIVDDGGHLIYFQRMDGTQTGSVLVSQRKAQTAIDFKRPSKVF